jgi:hypothetical protein
MEEGIAGGAAAPEGQEVIRFPIGGVRNRDIDT